MKLALQTISWGPSILDLRELLTRARDLGFQGVELAQLPQNLGPVDRLVRLAQETGVRIAGLAGGSLAERMEFARATSTDYLYLDEWEETAVADAISSHLRVGVHPHMFKTLGRVEDAVPYLTRFPQLGLILDVAHSCLAEENTVEELRRFRDRLLAVHLKDWTPRFGRSPFRFARGFVALGQGILSDTLLRVTSELASTSFEGWLVVEQDTAHGDPFDCARQSLDWLRDNGFVR